MIDSGQQESKSETGGGRKESLGLDLECIYLRVRYRLGTTSSREPISATLAKVGERG